MHEDSKVTFVLGPTNTGKTFYAIERMLSYETGIIGMPLRLLAREVYDKIVLKKGKLSVALVTGEEQIIPPRARYFVCTVEAMLTNKIVDFIAVDEIQLCNDFERGHIFTEKLFHARGNFETLFLGADTMEPIIKKLFPKSSILKKNRRSKLTYIGKKSFFSLPKRTAVVTFKTIDVYNLAARIKSQKGGAAVVLGALSPQTRNSQVSMFEEGEVDYLVATDAIGMGLNLNIDNVSFSSLEKYDGKEERTLNKNEIAQIAGRAGRNTKEGFFSYTNKTNLFTKELIESVEQNIFDPISFLYWRNKDLEFDSIKSLLNSLNKKNDNPFLVKTLNVKDEYILKFLSSNSQISKYLSNYDCIKTLWEISKIPDYIKSIDFKYTDLLIKLYLNIVNNGRIDHDWALREILKLKNLEGSIDELTFKLSKIRFWNYVSNKNLWFKDNSYLIEKAKETENILSKALHESLIREFVDSKLNVLVKEIKNDKKFAINITSKNEITFNDKIIGKINGIQAILYDKEIYKKNKMVYNMIIKKVSEAINNYIEKIINHSDFKINIKSNFDIYYNHNKIASLFKGEHIFKPKLLIANNEFITEQNYSDLKNRIELELQNIISLSFPEQLINIEKLNYNLRAIIFSLQENFGIIRKLDVIKFIESLSLNQKSFLKENNILFSKTHLFHKAILTKTHENNLRSILSSLFFVKKNIRQLIQKKVFINKENLNEKLLQSIGYIKLNKFVVKFAFLEYFFETFLSEKREVYCYNFYHYKKLNISFLALHEILFYFNLYKVAGTNEVSFWKKKKPLVKTDNYDVNNPFYVLNKLQ